MGPISSVVCGRTVGLVLVNEAKGLKTYYHLNLGLRCQTTPDYPVRNPSDHTWTEILHKESRAEYASSEIEVNIC